MTPAYRTLFHGLLLLALAGCATAPVSDFDTPQVELVGLQPLPPQKMEARFAVSLRVLNPNSVALDIEGVFYEIYLRDQKVLSGVSSQSAEIPAYGEGILELEASASMVRSLSLVRDLMEDPPDQGLPYTLKTKISLGNMPRAVRIEHKGLIGAR
jgi:LEA14-like dessication related protein